MALNAKFLTLNTVIKMEETTKIVKVYSNNKKSTRLKRNKNKFQRVWDAEKQKYVKVRKPKFAVFTKKVEKTVKSVDEQVKAAYARADRRSKAKKKKSVPVNAAQMEKKIAAVQPKSEKKVVAPAVHAKVDAPKPKKAIVVTLYGKKMQWDQEKVQYREAA